jgi:hypothetical protein
MTSMVQGSFSSTFHFQHRQLESTEIGHDRVLDIAITLEASFLGAALTKAGHHEPDLKGCGKGLPGTSRPFQGQFWPPACGTASHFMNPR